MPRSGGTLGGSMAKCPGAAWLYIFWPQFLLNSFSTTHNQMNSNAGWLTFIRVKSSQVIFYLFIIRFFFIILFCLRIFLFSRNIFLLINIYWVYFFFLNYYYIFFTVLRLFISLNFTCFFAWNFINFFCNFLYWILVLVFFFFFIIL